MAYEIPKQAWGKNKEERIDKRSTLKVLSKLEIRRVQVLQEKKARRNGMKEKKIQVEMVKRKSIHHALIAKRKDIQRSFSSPDLVCNVEIASNLAMWKKFAKTKGSSNNNRLIRLKLLMKIKLKRSSHSLLHASQSTTKSRRIG
ncbi:hypothetical protein PVK06_008767 [Gossypium arboreum]|uniref:Uncharacterized protein n=1 Tax=Gossypium arboreum TaxID=29729 RepID=A0ABR0QLW8_GOSAR|nr:hypothetical protein PVK06_008767 [Gossypium arboreum]